MNARFRIFRSGNGALHVWPPVGFPTRPAWRGASQVVFENSSQTAVVFEDTNGALEGSTPGQHYTLPAQSTVAFNLDRSVVLGNGYVFTIVSPAPVEQQPTTFAYVAENPEIIIVG
jgi:hypothetical protein